MSVSVSFKQLKRMEVIELCSGASLGCVCDLELDSCTGTVLSISVPGGTRCFGLLKCTEATIIPFHRIKKFGEDVILVELSVPMR